MKKKIIIAIAIILVIFLAIGIGITKMVNTTKQAITANEFVSNMQAKG